MSNLPNHSAAATSSGRAFRCHPTDIRVQAATVTFSDERLALPLRLSKGTIDAITYATVTLRVVDRRGRTGTGTGAILLSDVWAFPDPTYSHARKDVAMRQLCSELARRLPDGDSLSDPLQKLARLETVLTEATTTLATTTGIQLPRLAAGNCLAPFDAALHDAWAKMIGAPVYALYGEQWLNTDLAAYLGPDFKDRYPAHYLIPRRNRLTVQHVVGISDALTPTSVPAPATPELRNHPASLAAWMARDGLTSFKIKTCGNDPAQDAQRVQAVYATAVAHSNQLQQQPAVPAIRLSIDPNEGCPDAAYLLEMLGWLAQDAPEALAALDYIEQPTARDLDSYTFTLHAVARQKPVIMDESFVGLELLPMLAEQGWSGIALKTCKGQSLSLLAYAWAKQQGYAVTVQDLTNPGIALVHSANLCAHLDTLTDAFECNSRQYMPFARTDEQAAYPTYFHTEQGTLTLPPPTGGLY